MLKTLLNNTYFTTSIFFIYLFFLNFITFRNEEKVETILLLSFGTFLILLGTRNISKLCYKILIIFLIIVFIPYYISICLFGEIGYPQIAALYFTNSAETFSYLKTVPIYYSIKSLLLIIPLFYFWNRPLIELRKRYSIVLIILPVLVSFVKIGLQRNYLLQQGNTHYIYKTLYFTPIRILTKIGGSFSLVEKDLHAQETMKQKPSTWQITKNEKDDKILVFIIGESVRKDFMGIYNEKHSNTPFLNSVPKIQFQNMLSYGPRTIESLTNAFQQEIDNNLFFPNNIITLANKAGIKTHWISNQGSVGSNDSGIAAMGKQSSFSYFLTKGTFWNAQSDSKLLDIFATNLTSDPKSIYFLHTIGSHPYPCDITNGEYSTYVQSKSISCYIESIKRTDDFIKNVYITLMKTKKDFKIVYFSDHGMYISDDKDVRHRSDYKPCYEVPFIVIDSQLKENIFLTKTRNLKDFLLFYTEIMQVQTENMHYNYQFISEDFSPKANLLYDSKIYSELKDNSLTF